MHEPGLPAPDPGLLPCPLPFPLLLSPLLVWPLVWPPYPLALHREHTSLPRAHRRPTGRPPAQLSLPCFPWPYPCKLLLGTNFADYAPFPVDWTPSLRNKEVLVLRSLPTTGPQACQRHSLFCLAGSMQGRAGLWSGHRQAWLGKGRASPHPLEVKRGEAGDGGARTGASSSFSPNTQNQTQS